MSEAATHILREAKSLHQGLKDLLKTRDISDKEIEIQRKNLRRQYLRLLFVYPYVRESKDAETALWMQTSYALISIFKQRISALDRAIQHPPRQAQQPNHPPRTVEYRKLLQRFRQFLAEEEKFWTQLILRIRRHFELDDAQPALNALGIAFEDEQTPAMLAADASASGNASRRNQFQFPPELDSGTLDIAPASGPQRESRVALLSKALVCLGDIARYKEQYNEAGGRPRAGHEDGPPAIAGRRGRRGGGPVPHVALPRLRNYDRAQSCYEQARLLLPHDGNPSHQLAILSSYQKDIFSSLVHYYRALCVRQPFDTASENMTNVLSKTLETYRTKGLVRDRELEEEMSKVGQPAPRIRVEAFKEKIVVLHAQWCMNVDEAKSMGESVIEDFADLVRDRILPIDMISKVVILAQGALWKHRMVRRPGHGDRRHNRLHTTESNIVTHLVATHRVLLENGSVELTESPPEDAADHDLAQRITATFRRTLPALRMAGKWLRANTRYISQERRVAADSESATPTREAGRGRDRKHNALPVIVGDVNAFWNEYAKFCTTLMRLFPMEELPKLRTQLEEDVEMAGFLPLRKFMMGPDGRATGVATGTASPKENTSADDKANGSGDEETKSAEKESPVPRDQVHPNEEQLMRIWDILSDAHAIAEDENTLVAFEDNSFVFKGDVTSLAVVEKAEVDGTGSNTANTSLNTTDSDPSLLPAEDPREISQPVNEPDTVSSQGDPEFIRQVVDAVIAADDEDEEEDDQIVWSPPTGSLSPLQDPVVTPIANSNPQTISPPRLNPIAPPSAGFMTPRNPGALSPQTQPLPSLPSQRSPPMTSPSKPPLTTAEDLLKIVKGFPASHSRSISTPHIDLILGSGVPGSSIWSDKTQSKTLTYKPPSLTQPASNSNSYVSPPSRIPPPPLPSTLPSIGTWSTSQQPQPQLQQSHLWQSQPPPMTTQALNSYNQSGHLGNALSAPFVPRQQQTLVNGGHHRSPSDGLPLRSLGFGQPASMMPLRGPDTYSYDRPTPFMDGGLGMSGNAAATLGRGPASLIAEQLPLPTYGYPQNQNQIETAFYNAPNMGPSPNPAIRRDRMGVPQYAPISPPSRLWSNTG